MSEMRFAGNVRARKGDGPWTFTPDDIMLSAPEAARQCGVAVSTLRRLAKDHQIRGCELRPGTRKGKPIQTVIAVPLREVQRIKPRFAEYFARHQPTALPLGNGNGHQSAPSGLTVAEITASLHTIETKVDKLCEVTLLQFEAMKEMLKALTEGWQA